MVFKFKWLPFNWLRLKKDQIGFKLEDVVKVKHGVEDPDYKGLYISGYTGRISSIDSKLEHCLIALDSITLEQIHENHIRQMIDHGLDYTKIWLRKDEIIKTAARDTVDDVRRVVSELNNKFNHL